MEVTRLAIPDLLLITPPRFGDARGFFSETYNQERFAKIGITAPFVQDNHSLSARVGTIRGLHFQIPPRAQDKLIRVSRGAILDVAVDIRHGSPTFGQAVSAVLSAENWSQLWIPKGFAHGFCTLEPDTEVIYKVTDLYDPQCDRGLAWDDPALKIDWLAAPGEVTLSEKDKNHPRLADLEQYFHQD
jgi:dTDP-4-dehydrorhamnose 3,5-epimerase